MPLAMGQTSAIDPAQSALDRLLFGSSKRLGVMMRIPHELQDEFPDETVLITRPAKTNYLFRRLAGRYDEINRRLLSLFASS